MPQEAPRPLQDGSRWQRSLPRMPPRCPTPSKTYLPAYLLKMAFRGLKMAPRWPKRTPRKKHERPKTAPRAPNSAPRAPQEGPTRQS
eukprot:7334692-Pyramimonas_sp.AAC.1